MLEVSISQLWGRTWDLFKVNWHLFRVLLVLLPSIIVILICIIVMLIFHLIPIDIILALIVLLAYILLMPVLVRAGYLVARQGQPSFGDVFKDLSSLLKIFVYELTLLLISWILRDILVVADFADFIILFLFFGWAAPYFVLSGRAGIFSAIGQSFSLTWQNFSEVFVALLSVIGLLILGLLPLGLGLLVKDPDLILTRGLFYGLWLLVVISMVSVFLPLLYLALTGEEGTSHSKSLRLG